MKIKDQKKKSYLFYNKQQMKEHLQTILGPNFDINDIAGEDGEDDGET